MNHVLRGERQHVRDEVVLHTRIDLSHHRKEFSISRKERRPSSYLDDISALAANIHIVNFTTRSDIGSHLIGIDFRAVRWLTQTKICDMDYYWYVLRFAWIAGGYILCRKRLDGKHVAAILECAGVLVRINFQLHKHVAFAAAVPYNEKIRMTKIIIMIIMIIIKE